MPVIEFQRLPPDTEQGEISSQGDFLTVSMHSSHGENPNYNTTLAKWLGILHLTIAFCNVIDGIVITAMYYCRVALLGTFIWCGLPFYFLAGLLALMSRDKKTRTIRLYMVFSFLAMLVALVMMCFMLVSTIGDYHMGYPFMYVGDIVAAKLILRDVFSEFSADVENPDAQHEPISADDANDSSLCMELQQDESPHDSFESQDTPFNASQHSDAFTQTEDYVPIVKDQETQTVDRWRCAIDKNVHKVNIFGAQCRQPMKSKWNQVESHMFNPPTKGVQFDTSYTSSDASVECELVKGPPLHCFQPVSVENVCASVPDHAVEEPRSECDIVEDDAKDDADYVPPDDHYSSDSDYNLSDVEVPKGVVGQPKYLVFHTSIMELFEKCIECASPTKACVERPNGGTMIQVVQVCRKRGCGHYRTWRSQPMVGNLSAGNLMLSAGILASGSSPKKFLRTLTSMNVATFSYATFFNHQKWYLQPAVAHVWMMSQEDVLAAISAKTKKAFLGMDMRADSVGHSAKYGCYSTLEVEENKVLHVELVQKNECDNISNRMEKEGLIRTIKWLKKKDVAIGTIVTDRHRSIAKYIRETLQPQGIKHYYDVWHVAKGVKKKLLNVGKLTGCGEVKEWVQAITNNVYWLAASTPDGDGELMLAKFDSIVNHLHNVHHHDSPLFPACTHGQLPPRQWLKTGTKSSEEIDKVLGSVWLRKDVKMLSPSVQTSSVESFHSVINQFAPKMYVYSYEGMLCRIYLAALHYNENAGRCQASNTAGDPMFWVTYPRAKLDTGGYTVRKVLVSCTFNYAKEIMQRAVFMCQHNNKCKADYEQLTRNPGFLTDSVVKPVKADAVNAFVSRFSRTTDQVGRPAPQHRLHDPMETEDQAGTSGQAKKKRRKAKELPVNVCIPEEATEERLGRPKRHVKRPKRFEGCAEVEYS